MLESVVLQAPVLALGEQGPRWIEALPARKYHTAQYGEVPVTAEHLEDMVKNFKGNVRGQDIAVDFAHGFDPAKGHKASGWYKDFAVLPSSKDPNTPALFALVDFTEEAKAEIADKKWKYFSLEWDDVWVDNDGNRHENVITGGGLTNKPIAKNVLPINFSEDMASDLTDEEKKTFAVWSTAFVNDLPDSAFLYISPGGKKDGEGKTVPRSLRHLPYKDKSGKIDLPHLRNAIARIPQMKGISADLKARLQSRARRLLGSSSKSMSEEERAAFDLLTASGYDVVDETKEWEHSEPGTGSPPQPKTEEDGSDDDSIKEGWRRPTPPDQTQPSGPSGLHAINEEGSTVGDDKKPEFVYSFSEDDARALFHTLDINSDTKPSDVVVAVKRLVGDYTELKGKQDASQQEKEFSEKYPDYWAEHNKLMEENREGRAKAFSESVKTVRRTEGQGLKDSGTALSPIALEKVAEVHKKFAEKQVTQEDFEECIKTIVNGGIVQFGEIGSSGTDDVPVVDASTASGVATAKRVFADVMAQIKKDNPDWDMRKVMTEASSKHPDLAEAASKAVAA